MIRLTTEKGKDIKYAPNPTLSSQKIAKARRGCKGAGPAHEGGTTLEVYGVLLNFWHWYYLRSVKKFKSNRRIMLKVNDMIGGSPQLGIKLF